MFGHSATLPQELLLHVSSDMHSEQHSGQLVMAIIVVEVLHEKLGASRCRYHLEHFVIREGGEGEAVSIALARWLTTTNPPKNSAHIVIVVVALHRAQILELLFEGLDIGHWLLSEMLVESPIICI